MGCRVPVARYMLQVASTGLRPSEIVPKGVNSTPVEPPSTISRSYVASGAWVAGYGLIIRRSFIRAKTRWAASIAFSSWERIIRAGRAGGS